MNLRFHFFRTGVSGVTRPPSLRTLDEFMVANGHAVAESLILKLDVEGAEWDVLLNAAPGLLDRCAQIVIEMHGLAEAAAGPRFRTVRDALARLKRTHQLIHVHGNNYASMLVFPGLVLPSCVEATFVSRTIYGSGLVDCTQSFPTPLDAPNHPMRAEIPLGDLGRSLRGRRAHNWRAEDREAGQ